MAAGIGLGGWIPARDAASDVVFRSPRQLVLRRLRRSPATVLSAAVCLLLLAAAAAAPLIARVYGTGPQDTFQADLDQYGMPYGVAGGVSAAHWMGLEPALGRDLFVQLLFGLRTSLGIAVTAAVVATALGALLGGLAGYLGGWVDTVVCWVVDVALTLPFLISAIALIRPLELHFYGPRDVVPGWFRVVALTGLFVLFGWTSTARLVRGQVLSLRGQDFVAAARAGGARTWWILRRELLPNLDAPILVSFTLLVPTFITAAAGLSFLGVGVLEPTPDIGRTIYRSLDYLQTDPGYVLFPGAAIFTMVFAFSVAGDGLRDALDPRPGR